MSDLNLNIIYYKRRLPHAYIQNNPVFITWRLKFTLPRQVLQSLKEQKEVFEKNMDTLGNEYQQLQKFLFSKKQFNWLDEHLTSDASYPQILKRSDVAEIIINAMHFLDTKKYCLHSFCIMPNHVHVLLTPYSDASESNTSLSEITHSLKRFTAREINKLLGKEGALWNKESYDHYIRNEKEFERILEYIKQNPVKAGLVMNWQDWQYTWVDESLLVT
jgi:putative transposase